MGMDEEWHTLNQLEEVACHPIVTERFTEEGCIEWKINWARQMVTAASIVEKGETSENELVKIFQNFLILTKILKIEKEYWKVVSNNILCYKYKRMRIIENTSMKI